MEVFWGWGTSRVVMRVSTSSAPYTILPCEILQESPCGKHWFGPPSSKRRWKASERNAEFPSSYPASGEPATLATWVVSPNI